MFIVMAVVVIVGVEPHTLRGEFVIRAVIYCCDSTVSERSEPHLTEGSLLPSPVRSSKSRLTRF